MSKPLRKGQALVEFAIVALILFLLLGVILSFGRGVHSLQVLQQAADVLARQLAQTPLPPNMTFEEALDDPEVRSRIYDPEKLVIDIDDLTTKGVTINEHFATLPTVNQQLRSLMIFDQVGGRRVFRYPGALVSDPSSSSGFRVLIPFVESRSVEGVETIQWTPVVEEIEPQDTSNPNRDPFTLSSAKQGLVSVRVNFPFQASALSAYQQPGNQPIEAKDSDVVAPSVPGGGTLVTPDNPFGPYAGQFGLGKQAALGKEVRPFRRLLSAQAIYRREIFR